MSLLKQPDVVSPHFQEAMYLRKCWGWFMVLGIGLIGLGAAAGGAPLLTTITTVLWFGIFLIAGGVVQIVNAFVARSWKGFFLDLLAGVLHLIVGGLMVEHPARAAEDLTLMLAVAFLLAGAYRILYVLFQRFEGWPWVLLNGIVTLMLGIAIWRRWPESSYKVIGILVGIDLIFNGWSWVMLALAVKSPPEARPVGSHH